jgi:hypothetical protein
MRERARLLQADLQVGRRPQGGTAVTVHVPLPLPEKEPRRWNLFRAVRRRATPAA